MASATVVAPLVPTHLGFKRLRSIFFAVLETPTKIHLDSRLCLVALGYEGTAGLLPSAWLRAMKEVPGMNQEFAAERCNSTRRGCPGGFRPTWAKLIVDRTRH